MLRCGTDVTALDRFQSVIKRTGLQNVSVPAGTHEGSVTISDAIKRAEGPFGAEDPIYAIRGAEDGARSHRNELAFSVGHRKERILRWRVGPMANHVLHQAVPVYHTRGQFLILAWQWYGKSRA